MFEIGKVYYMTDWFTGGVKRLTCVKRTESHAWFRVTSTELDGAYITNEDFEIKRTDSGREYVLIYEYHGKENRLYGSEECV